MKRLRHTLIEEALHQRRALGTRDFFVRQEEMARLVEFVLKRTTRPILSLNRPQTGTPRLVHRLEWLGLKFSSVSVRPLVVS